jgi:hypothetical protein
VIIFDQMSRHIAKTGQVFRIGNDCQAKPKKSRLSLTAEQVVVLWQYREPGSALFLVTKLRQFRYEAAAIGRKTSTLN